MLKTSVVFDTNKDVTHRPKRVCETDAPSRSFKACKLGTPWMGFVCPALPKGAQSESISGEIRAQVCERGGWTYVLLLSALLGLSVSLPSSVQAGGVADKFSSPSSGVPHLVLAPVWFFPKRLVK